MLNRSVATALAASAVQPAAKLVRDPQRERRGRRSGVAVGFLIIALSFALLLTPVYFLFLPVFLISGVAFGLALGTQEKEYYAFF